MTVLASSLQAPAVEAVLPVASDCSSTELRDFDALYREHFPYIWRTLRRLGIDERDREDAVNDVFHRVYQRLSEFDPARPIKPWLFAFAARVASDYRKRAYRHREVLDQEAIEVAIDTTRSANDDARDLVLKALDALDLDKRAILILHDLDQQTVPEIAVALEIPVNTAYSRLRVAREHFTAAVRRMSGQRDGRSQ
jgi:RNA polymerase sigma-70 factor (ECF subfamily)